MISASSIRGLLMSCLSSGRGSWSVALLPNSSAVEPESATEQAETCGTYSLTNHTNWLKSLKSIIHELFYGKNQLVGNLFLKNDNSSDKIKYAANSCNIFLICWWTCQGKMFSKMYFASLLLGYCSYLFSINGKNKNGFFETQYVHIWFRIWLSIGKNSGLIIIN